MVKDINRMDRIEYHNLQKKAFEQVEQERLERIREQDPESYNQIIRTREQLNREKREREEYSKRDEERSRREWRRDFLKIIIATPFIIAGFGCLIYGAINQEREKQIKINLENKIRKEQNYILPSDVSFQFRGTHTNPTTTATYNGREYFFKVDDKGVPYFEPINKGGK